MQTHLKKSFPKASEEKVTLLHERGQSIELVAEFERTPHGLLAGIERYYEYERNAIEKRGADMGRIFLVIFDLAFSDAEIAFIVKDEDLKIRRAAAYIQRYESLSILRPVLAANVIDP